VIYIGMYMIRWRWTLCLMLFLLRDSEFLLGTYRWYPLFDRQSTSKIQKCHRYRTDWYVLYCCEWACFILFWLWLCLYVLCMYLYVLIGSICAWADCVHMRERARYWMPYRLFIFVGHFWWPVLYIIMSSAASEKALTLDFNCYFAA
jgi:hypothetical protein